MCKNFGVIQRTSQDYIPENFFINIISKTNMIKLIEIPFLSDSIIWILVGIFIINFVIHLEPHNAIA